MGLVRGAGDRRSSASVVPCSDAKTLVPSSLNVQKRSDVGRKRSETETFQSVVSRSITSLNVSIERRRTSSAPLILQAYLVSFPRIGRSHIVARRCGEPHRSHFSRMVSTCWTPVHAQSLWCCEPFRPFFLGCKHLQDVRVATGVEWRGWWVSDLVDDVIGDFN